MNEKNEMFGVVQEAMLISLPSSFFSRTLIFIFFCVLPNKNYVNPGDMASVWLLSECPAGLELRSNCSKAWLKQSN